MLGQAKPGLDPECQFLEKVLKPKCHPLAGKKIVVAGAGIAGLAFVVSLQKLWRREMGPFPQIVQYERDRVPYSIHRDGYSISLHNDTLSPTLQTLGKIDLLDVIMGSGIVRTGDKKALMGLWSRRWRTLMKLRRKRVHNLPALSVRIARTTLRSILLQAATKSTTIRWGLTCTDILPSMGGEAIRLRLDDQTEEECDFLVAADGANSKLRASIRPDDKLIFSGVVSISAISHFYGPPPEPLSHNWGIVPGGQGVALFASPYDKQSAFWSLSYKSDVPRQELRQPLSAEINRSLLEEARLPRRLFHRTISNSTRTKRPNYTYSNKHHGQSPLLALRC